MSDHKFYVLKFQKHMQTQNSIQSAREFEVF